MSKSTNLIDGSGKSNFSFVDEGGFLRIQNSTYPPVYNDSPQIVFREFLTLNGDGTTTSMIVNGSVTKQLFYIQAEPDYDIYIKNLSVLLAGVNNASSFVLFGSITAIANGCRLYYEDTNGEVNIGTQIRTNFDLVRLSLGNPAFGSRYAVGGTTDNPMFLPNVDGTSDAIFPTISLSDTFGFKYGIKLRNSTNNKLVFEINDNLTSAAPSPITIFNIIAYGFKRKVS